MYNQDEEKNSARTCRKALILKVKKLQEDFINADFSIVNNLKIVPKVTIHNASLRITLYEGTHNACIIEMIIKHFGQNFSLDVKYDERYDSSEIGTSIVYCQQLKDFQAAHSFDKIIKPKKK